jgi:hypothetical protein
MMTKSTTIVMYEEGAVHSLEEGCVTVAQRSRSHWGR